MKKFLSLILVIIGGYLASYVFVGQSKGYPLIPEMSNTKNAIRTISKFFSDLGKLNVSKEDSLQSVEYFKSALEKYNNGNYQEAVWDFDYAYQKNPFFYDALYYKSKSYFYLEDYISAYINFEDLINETDEFDSAYLYLGISYFQDQKYEDAERELLNYLSIDENSEEALYWIAKNKHLRGYTEKALEMIDEKIIKLNPEYVYAYILKSDIYIEKYEYTKAISNLRKAYDLNPENYYLVLKMGMAYKTINKIDSAFYFYNEALELNSNNDAAVFYELSQIYFKKRNYTKAIEYINTAIDTEYLTEYIDLRAKIYKAKGEYKNAITNFNECYSYYSDISYLLEIADCYEKLGDYETAIKYYSDYIDLTNFEDTLRIYVLQKIDKLQKEY